jgi:pimeloyl-ACP methyl ester carboxylesterase
LPILAIEEVRMSRSRWLTAALSLAIVTFSVAAPAWAQSPRAFRVQVTGTGSPIIFIPGLASSGDTWAATVQRYRGRFTCHVLTLAGFAGVPPIDGPLIATVENELVAYIREQGLSRPVLVGHSLGGMLALAVATHHLDVVGGLVIVDAMPFPAGSRFQVDTVAKAEPAIAAGREKLLKMTPKEYDDYARSGAATRYMVTSAEHLATIAQWGRASDQRAIADALAEFYRMDLREDLARIQVPALVLGTWKGVHDEVATYGGELTRPVFTRAFAEQYAQLRRMHFALSDTARHFVMFDDPAWFFAQLDSFLADPISLTRERGIE